MLPIRPGKVTCAGVVAILMVLPNSIWKGPGAQVAPSPQPKIVKTQKTPDPHRPRAKVRHIPVNR